jgi:hypothetical protein
MKKYHEEKRLVDLADRLVNHVFEQPWFQSVVDQLAKEDSGTVVWSEKEWQMYEDTYQYKLYYSLLTEYTMIVLNKACTKLHAYGHTDQK